MNRTIVWSLLLFAFSTERLDAQTTAFYADFNMDTAGEQPNLSPPGPPSGDAISLNTAGGSVTVEATYGVMTDQPLVMDRVTTGAHTAQFILDPTSTGCDTYAVRWTAMITEATDNINISFRNETNSVMAQFHYRPNGVLAYNGFTNEIATGYAPNVPQDFEVMIDIPAGTTSLSIDGVPDPKAQNRPFVFPNFSETFDNFIVGFAGLEYEEFIIDDIEIIATACDVVPTERSSWSALKATFD